MPRILLSIRPLANQWTLDVLNPRKWTREFYWGELGDLLISNGYDYDLLNDDALQNIARIENGNIKIRNMEYKVLLLPNITSLPLETMQFIKRYISEGGTVIALERIPDSLDRIFRTMPKRIELVKNLSLELFEEPRGRDGTGSKSYGSGHTHFIKTCYKPSDLVGLAQQCTGSVCKYITSLYSTGF